MLQKNEHVLTEGFSDPGQVMKNGSDLQNNVVVSPSMLPNSQNSPESDMGSAMVYKTIDHLAGSAIQAAPLNMQHTSMFDPIGRRVVPLQPSQESDIVHVDPLPQPQSVSWQSGHSTACSVLNNTSCIQEEKSGSASISNSYSQG